MSGGDAALSGDGSLVRARACFEAREWGEAFALLEAASAAGVAEPADLERLASAAHLTGREDLGDETWARAHEAYLRAADEEGAARCAFWLGFGLLLRAEGARGAGWLGRAQRLVDAVGHDCAIAGWLLVPRAVEELEGGDPGTALALATEVSEIGARLGDADLVAVARLTIGEALIGKGEVTAGVGELDEAMVAVTAGEVTPYVAGIIYCAVILACQSILDVGRAREWTAALNDWCAAQPDIVHYRGVCLVHRSEVLQVGGAWPDALDAACRACERLAGHPAIGNAFYQRGELHRLQGAFDDAEEAYRSASRWGREPQPGLALLRLEQGNLDAAVASIRRVVDETHDRGARSRVLAAQVEITVAAGALDVARTAADELVALAAANDAPVLRAIAGRATGAVLLAEGDARAALDALRPAWETWRDIDAPYEAARVRVLIGLACRALGDEDAAVLELEAARAVFEDLGAGPDVVRVGELAGTPDLPCGLSTREAEVLALVAAGKTNREIADALVLSEHTVRRHLQNIFAKIGVRTRAAATAFAYQHELA